MRKIRCVLVEDDPISLKWLADTVASEFEEIEVCGMATNVQDAIYIINSTKPDLLLSDVELGEGTSFEILPKIDDDIEYGVIFITSFEKYAYKAFQASAIDYITKPADEESLKLAIEKFKTNRSQRKQIDGLLENLKGDREVSRLAIPVGNSIELVNVADILYMRADVNYCHIFIENEKPLLVSRTLKEYDTLLRDNQNFMRIHQSYLVNMDKVKKVVRTKLPQVIISNGDVLSVSRAKKSEFDDYIFRDKYK